MKRSVELVDAEDRATKKLELEQNPADRGQFRSRHGMHRIPLEDLGFLEENRGGTGMSGFHAMEVAHDAMENGVYLERYNYVAVVRIPTDRLDDFRRINEKKCETDPMMPAFSATMRYGILMKTHWTHACKLAKSGRLLFNTAPKIIFRGKEWDEIREKGVLCLEYDASLLDDKEALACVMSQDNLNAAIAMQEGEVQAFGRLSTIMANSENQDARAIVAELKSVGVSNYSEEDLMSMLRLREKLPGRLATAFLSCQNQVIGGRVRVRPGEYGQVARLDDLAPWVKIAILLHIYQSTLKLQQQQGAGDTKFTGRRETLAKRIAPNIIMELASDPHFVVEVERFIRDMFKVYKGDTGAADPGKVLEATTNFLSDVGKLVLTVASSIDQVKKTSKGLGRDATDEDIRKAKEKALQGRFSSIEASYRKLVTTANLFTSASLPAVRHAAPAAATSPSEEQHTAPIHRVTMDEAGEVVQNVQTVFSRLRIKKFGESVSLRRPYTEFLAPLPEPEQVPVKKELRECTQCGSPSTVADVHCLRCGFEFPALSQDAVAGKKSTPGTKSTPGGDLAGTRSKPAIRMTLKSLELPQAAAESKCACGTAQAVCGACGKGWAQQRANAPTAVVTVFHDLIELSHQTDITVDVDELLPFVAPQVAPTVAKHPVSLLKEQAHKVSTFEFGGMSTDFMRQTLHASLGYLHITAAASVRGVELNLMSEIGKIPIVAQARATKDFKKGELVLVPYGGEIKPKVKDAGAFVNKPTHKGNTVHEALLGILEGKVRGVKGKCSGQEPLDADNIFVSDKAGFSHCYSIASPLLKARQGSGSSDNEELFERAAPFWAVLRTPVAHDSANGAPNMILSMEAFEANGYAPVAGKFPKFERGCKLVVEIPIMRNTRRIEKDDQLLLSFDDA